MKIVYVAGPYIGDGHFLTIEQNIREAEAFAIRLATHGIGFFCPHLNSTHFELKTACGQQFWYDMDLRILQHCDAIAFSPRWRESSGCRMEREYAIDHHIPVLSWSDLEEWANAYRA